MTRMGFLKEKYRTLSKRYESMIHEKQGELSVPDAQAKKSK